MALDLTSVGREFGPVERSWTSKDTLLYAVACGAGTDELSFTTENTKGVAQQTLPSWAVLMGMAPGGLEHVGPFDRTKLLHGEQSFSVTGPVPVEGRVSVTGRIVGIYDKGSGALVVTEGVAVDAESGEERMRVKTGLFIRGEGGFGGDSGPASDGATISDAVAPNHSLSYVTSKDQALVYRLASGDRNPLHSDPAFAARGGFDRPILHGLCSYGFTCRALVHLLCGGDAGRLRSMHARFLKPVLPGDELTVSVWSGAAGDAAFRTTTQRGETVIDGGHVTFVAP